MNHGKYVFGLFWLVSLGSVVGCSSEEELPPDPLSTRDGFCDAWATQACTDQVVSACAAASPEACELKQQQFCASVVPASAYTLPAGKTCLGAVKAAFSDARLTADEVDTVLRGENECSFECVMISDGECIPPMVAMGGQDCSEATTVCAEGFYCDGNNCLEDRREGRACSETIPCAEGLKCVGEVGAQMCVAKAGTGQDCVDDSDCVSGICTVPAGQTTGICAAEIILSAAEPTCAQFR